MATNLAARKGFSGLAVVWNNGTKTPPHELDSLPQLLSNQAASPFRSKLLTSAKYDGAASAVLGS